MREAKKSLAFQHLRTVLRIQTDTFDASGTLTRTDERYLISSLPSIRLTADHWLLVARRHWGVETSHQILDNAFEEDDHPWIEACPRAALVVAILRRIAYTMLALFRSVTQRSDERRAIPWQTLLTDLFVASPTPSASCETPIPFAYAESSTDPPGLTPAPKTTYPASRRGRSLGARERGPGSALPDALRDTRRGAASPEPAPAPEAEPLPGAALARALFYGSRLVSTGAGMSAKRTSDSLGAPHVVFAAR